MRSLYLAAAVPARRSGLRPTFAPRAAVVRKLLSAVSFLGASSGVLVSTSGFTAAALALAAGTPIVLRTLEEVLAAKSVSELLDPNKSGR
jgi:Restriction endonuclease